MTCGVYKLNFKNTCKVYIGQSENIEYRFTNHLRSFKNGLASKKLLNAYAVFGAPTLEILVECEKHELSSLENEAIQIYNSFYNGFNSQETAETLPILVGEEHPGSKYSNTQVEQAFLLLVTKTCTHQQVADKTGVSKNMVNHIAIGTCHNWLAVKYPQEHAALVAAKPKSGNSLQRGKVYSEVVSPEGKAYQVDNLRKFSREHNLPYSSLNALVNRHTNQVRGWTLKTEAI